MVKFRDFEDDILPVIKERFLTEEYEEKDDEDEGELILTEAYMHAQMLVRALLSCEKESGLIDADDIEQKYRSDLTAWTGYNRCSRLR